MNTHLEDLPNMYVQWIADMYIFCSLSGENPTKHSCSSKTKRIFCIYQSLFVKKRIWNPQIRMIFNAKLVLFKVALISKNFKTGKNNDLFIVTFLTEDLDPCEFVFTIKSFHVFDENIFPILFSFFHSGPYLRSFVIYPSPPKSENIVNIWDERVE